jgi:hypothetical protein
VDYYTMYDKPRMGNGMTMRGGYTAVSGEEV